ncbi:putative rRNA maturation factor [Trypanosoma grayi]|uniref:putative rRNA maturation factor n=1 Tax=Trypanosoma grayi TaxID=71804 RepID=UPI0004F47D42|nr:putative rRNA maturation factor [Trypanosoma grayi]KEG15307.1 putative rRNA maturation factor [Trypanosoma grayi]
MPRPFYRRVCIHGATPRFGDAVQKLAEAVLWLERAPASVELSIRFAQPSQMQALNHEHRGIDRPTDVLTFPGSGSGTPEVCWSNELILSHPHNDPDADEWSAFESSLRQQRAMLLDLGDIYFSVEYVWLRCLRRPERNLRFHDYLQAALTHAMLHALGYNHDTPESWRKMSRREKFLAQQLVTWQRRWPGCLTELDGIEFLTSARP